MVEFYANVTNAETNVTFVKKAIFIWYNMRKGVVIKIAGGWHSVKTEDGDTIRCKIRGNLRTHDLKTTNPLAVGDQVTIEMEGDNTGVVKDIIERKNYIIRKATRLDKQSHILAANVDQAMLMVTLLQPVTFSEFIDRFLVSAEASGVNVVLLFNKIDLCDEKHTILLEKMIDIYRKIGYHCVKCSVKEKINIEEVSEILKEKVTLLVGNSGVGKTALINLLVPLFELKTGDISKYERGVHTTSHTEMYSPSSGGYIIDTPGLKAYGIIEIEKELLSHCFPEMRRLINDCRFNNCLHIKEPKCAVLDALRNGGISRSRYKSYLEMFYSDEKESYRRG